jgi:hypothetical protein
MFILLLPGALLAAAALGVVRVVETVEGIFTRH